MALSCPKLRPLSRPVLLGSRALDRAYRDRACDPGKTLGASAFRILQERPVCSMAIIGVRHSADSASSSAPSAPAIDRFTLKPSGP